MKLGPTNLSVTAFTLYMKLVDTFIHSEFQYIQYIHIHHVFFGNGSHELSVASAVLYQLSSLPLLFPLYRRLIKL